MARYLHAFAMRFVDTGLDLFQREGGDGGQLAVGCETKAMRRVDSNEVGTVLDLLAYGLAGSLW